MDFWMVSSRELPHGLASIFTALTDLLYQYDWVISDTNLYFLPETPEAVKKRWSWTGLLMEGQELARHLAEGYVHIVCGGVFSAVPKGTRAAQVNGYMPVWEIDKFGSSEYTFQIPLTQLEILNYDGYAWVLICGPEFSAKVQKALPQAKRPDAYYAAYG